MNEIKSICGYCEHFNMDNNQCENKKGKLYGIKLTDQLIDAEHDCKKYSEIHYVITPKGLLWSALDESGVNVDSNTFDEIWDNFVFGMEKHGYLKNEETNENDDEYTEESEYGELY